MKQFFLFCLILAGIVALGAWWYENNNKSLSLKPSPEASPVFLKALLDFTDTIDATDVADSEIEELNAILSQDYSNIPARMFIVYYYKLKMDYRKVLGNLEIIIDLDPELADPHFHLGEAYYELALLDMVLRGNYKTEQFEQGFKLPLFRPDATTKQIFSKAIDEFNIGFKLTKTLTTEGQDGTKSMYYTPEKARQQLRQASTYISGQTEQSIFTIDVIKMYKWFTVLAEQPQKNFERLVTQNPNPAIKWIDRAHENELKLINLAHRKDQEQLFAATKIARNLVMWDVSQTVDAFFPISEETTQDLISQSAEEIINNLAILQYSLDSTAINILKSGSPDMQKRQYVMEQIDRNFNNPEQPEIRAYAFLIALNRSYLLGILSKAPLEYWTELWSDLIQWNRLKDFSEFFEVPHSKIQEIEQIETELLSSSNQNDAQEVDKWLSHFSEWCNWLLQYMLDIHPSYDLDSDIGKDLLGNFFISELMILSNFLQESDFPQKDVEAVWNSEDFIPLLGEYVKYLLATWGPDIANLPPEEMPENMRTALKVFREDIQDELRQRLAKNSELKQP